ncbi:MAG: hypothetical protein HC901_03345 [Bdellovibrionaceae bacterium]|nr:hypothetical protein [Pseudobdellovibrionaceae bacterium]
MTPPATPPTDVNYTVRGGSTPGNGTDTLATLVGSNNTWVLGTGSVTLDSPSNGTDTVTDNATVGSTPRRFLDLLLELVTP